MKNKIVLVGLVFLLLGCEKPLPSVIAARIVEGKLNIQYSPPENERWYNKQCGRLEFNGEETQYLKEVLISPHKN